MAHVAEHKKKTVVEFTKLLLDNPIIGMVNMENLPAKQLQTIIGLSRGRLSLKMTKRRLMKLAFAAAEEKKPGLSILLDHARGMPALLFTQENPFRLYKFLQKNKSPAPAKAGQIAPHAIVIPAGPTPFAPGPIIGELGALRIKTGVENNKVVVKVDSVVCKDGEMISAKLAELLTRFNILPMEVGLDLVAIFENGEVLEKTLLAVDEDRYIADLSQAAQWANNLAVEAGIASKDTIELLLSTAQRHSLSLGREANIMADELVGEILAKAESTAKGLSGDLNFAVEEKPAPKKEKHAEEPAKQPETPKEKRAEEKPEPVEKEEPTPEPVEGKAQVEEPTVEEIPSAEPKEAPAEEKKEEPAPEPKEERPEEKKEPAPKHTVQDDKIASNVEKLLQRTKDFAEGKIPKADDLLKEG
ncbi:MAG: 50S ribosomal protein L10 [Nanoarchaeota archaeon]